MWLTTAPGSTSPVVYNNNRRASLREVERYTRAADQEADACSAVISTSSGCHGLGM